MCVLFPCGAFRGVFGQFQRSATPLHIMSASAHVLMVLLGSAFVVLALLCFLVFPLPPLPTQGSRGLSLIVFFSIELTVQCDGYLIWGLVWWAGLVAGLQVGQAYGMFHRPGFGLLVPVPRSLSTQSSFATQALKSIIMESKDHNRIGIFGKVVGLAEKIFSLLSRQQD